MSWLQAIILGAVQGLTEFLPVSSSGHLALSQELMARYGWGSLPSPESPEMLLFDLAAHLGTLLAVLAVFATVIRLYLRGLIRELPRWRELTGPKPPAALYVTVLAVVAIIPTGLIGLGFKDFFESAFGRPMLIGVALLMTGTLLLLSGLRSRPRRGWRRFPVWAAFLVGVAQGVAVTPGISRSGSTTCAALLLGLRRRWAGQFSFLIAIAPILGASLIHFKEVWETVGFDGIALGPILAGSVVAGLVGYVALQLFLVAIQRARLACFAVYCYLVGAAAVIASLTGLI